MKSILELVEDIAVRRPQSPALADDKEQLTYRELVTEAQKIGCTLARPTVKNQPVAILMDKTPHCAAAMLGVVYSGNFYVVLDTKMPPERICRIFETLKPYAIFTDRAHEAILTDLDWQGNTFFLEEARETEIDHDMLLSIRCCQIDTDPMYALYTSGSTGQPKGAIVSHRAVMAYTKWAVDTFHFGESTVFGSQTPFYFSMSVTDLLGSLCSGGCLVIIPRQLFSFPLSLIQYMNERRVNTIYWVPSALGILANWDAFTYAKPEHLQKVLFAGESMPNKYLNYWRRHLPDIYFANLFGPTETTDICTYYPVTRPFADDEPLPIGVHCDNCDVFAVTEDGREAGPGETGELYARGSFLAMGYYRNPQKTKEVFVQNPLQNDYPEIVYRTGDLVRWNEYGELMYLGRKDFQIKHLGYRIELGEIETAALSHSDVQAAVCLYDKDTDQLVLVYQGHVREETLRPILAEKLPIYMYPEILIRVREIPLNANGKMDRSYLNQHYKELMP